MKTINIFNKIYFDHKDSLISILEDELFKNQLFISLDLIKKKIFSGKSVFICGNGGSASNADHLENDLLIISKKNYKSKVYSLCSNTAVISKIANDYGYENIFSEQLKLKSNPGDLLIIFSGSGNSLNVIKAVKYANKNGLETIGFIGYDGGKVLKLLNHKVHINNYNMQVIENVHLIITHSIMSFINKTL